MVRWSWSHSLLAAVDAISVRDNFETKKAEHQSQIANFMGVEVRDRYTCFRAL